jgi:hypothetical protein
MAKITNDKMEEIYKKVNDLLVEAGIDLIEGNCILIIAHPQFIGGTAMVFGKGCSIPDIRHVIANVVLLYCGDDAPSLDYTSGDSGIIMQLLSIKVNDILKDVNKPGPSGGVA